MTSLADNESSVGIHNTTLKSEHLPADTVTTHRLPVTNDTQEILSQVAENKEIETALNQVFAGTLISKGTPFFESLVINLATALQVPYAVITEEKNGTLQILAFWKDGELVSEGCYGIKETPCWHVIKDGSYHCPRNVQQTFPLDHLLVELEAESYYGIVLKDPAGRPIGNLYVLDREPMVDITVIEGVLQIFAMQAAAELQQQQIVKTIQQLSDENARLYQQEQQKSEALETAIAELQNTQLQLVQSEKMSALGGLVSGVAHEINNPVGCILGNVGATRDYIDDLLGLLDLYAQQFPDPGSDIEKELKTVELDYVREDLPQLIRAMHDSGERIKSISRSLRTFSRADTETKQTFDLREGIESTVLILQHRLKANERRPAIEVVTDYGNIPHIACFPGQLNQVFMNILANAVDALDEASQHQSYSDMEANSQSITIRTRVENDWLEVSISDNGPGIPDEIEVKIFDHSFTTKSVGKGTGLGLAIARQIVEERHGGTLTVQSALGQGTEFSIRLPL